MQKGYSSPRIQISRRSAQLLVRHILGVGFGGLYWEREISISSIQATCGESAGASAPTQAAGSGSWRWGLVEVGGSVGLFCPGHPTSVWLDSNSGNRKANPTWELATAAGSCWRSVLDVGEHGPLQGDALTHGTRGGQSYWLKDAISLSRTSIAALDTVQGITWHRLEPSHSIRDHQPGGSC